MPSEEQIANLTFKSRTGDHPNRLLRRWISILLLYPGVEIAISTGIYLSTDRINSAIVLFALSAIALLTAVILVWRRTRLMTALAFLLGTFYVAVVAATGYLIAIPALSAIIGLSCVGFLFFKEDPRTRA
jgi:hypothetical protein